MGMSWIDWAIIISIISFITYSAITTEKYTKSVADFLAAGRCSGKYLLGMAEGEAAMGAITIICLFEIFTRTGFTKFFWDQMTILIGLFITLSGFVIYRYRASRAMTMGQFFEMRYSRKFRIFAGVLAWVSGIINFGIFPAVGARFFINFMGFENIFWQCGPFEINLTLAGFLAILIGLALFFTFIGGQIAVLVTDFWQGFFGVIVFFILFAFICIKFPWSHMSEALVIGSKPGESLINPLDIGNKQNFNFTFFAIMWFFIIYNRMAWQGTQAYNCSATTPHEAKMAKIVGSLREAVVVVALFLLPLTAITILNHPDYTDKALSINSQLEHTFSGNETLKTQMLVPVALKNILPVGLLGGFAAVMLGFFISTNNTYMHSWGSIFIQDIVCVVRKKPLTPKQHMLYLRLSIIFVAVFAFFFSLLFPLKEYIWMFMIITGAIYLGGAGSAIIGGLYWKRGTTAGAWTAMTLGCVLSVSAITAQQIWPHIPEKVAGWYDLKVSQQLQIEAKPVAPEGWPNWVPPKDAKKDGLTEPRWFTECNGLTIEMIRLHGRGAKAAAPFPKQKIRKLRDGREVITGVKPATVGQIVEDPDVAKSYVLRAEIIETLSDGYYHIRGENGNTMIAKILPKLPYSSQVMSFWAIAVAIMSYIVVSLISKGSVVNMDRLFHKGKYAIQAEEMDLKAHGAIDKPVGRFWRLIGVNSHEFSKVDKGLFLYMVIRAVWWVGSFVVLLALGLAGQMTDQGWLTWWHISIYIMLGIAFAGGVWVSIGGLFDLRKMYQRLGMIKRNDLDDGRVVGNHNLADEILEGKERVQRNMGKD